MAKFDLNDDSVVVHHRLRRRRRHARQRAGAEGHQGRDPGGRRAHRDTRTSSTTSGTSFAQLAWLDKRTTSGNWRVAQGLPEPAGLDRQGGRRLDHALGRRLAALPGARVQGTSDLRRHRRRQPARLADHAGRDGALVRQGRGQDGRDPHQRHPAACPATTTSRCWRPAPRSSATRKSTPATWRSTAEPRDGRGACQQIGFCFQGCKSGAKWSTLYTEIPKGEATGNLEVRPNAHGAARSSTTHSGKVTGVVYADKDGKQQRQKARVVCGRRQLASRARACC